MGGRAFASSDKTDAAGHRILTASDVHVTDYPTVEAVRWIGQKLEQETGGRLKLRVSPEMVERLQIQGRLATGDHRLADLTVVWDEAQGEVVRVRDDARLRDANARFAEWDSLWDEASYEFTDERQSVAA